MHLGHVLFIYGLQKEIFNYMQLQHIAHHISQKYINQ
jgi:hypothetical protein